MIHVLGNVLTNVSLGHVAVSFTHTVKVGGRWLHVRSMTSVDQPSGSHMKLSLVPDSE
jgi:hypothetical protein